MDKPCGRECKECGELTDSGYWWRRKWLCDVCAELRLQENRALDRFERTERDLRKHRRDLGIE